MNYDLPEWKDVTRIEVIQEVEGRQLVRYNILVEAVSIQDEGRTLKIFINKRK